MSMIIWRFKTRRPISNIASAIGFIAFMVFLLLLVALTSPPQYRLNNTLGLAIFIIPITVVFLMLGNVFSKPFEVVFTEDGLVVRGRGGFTVPKDAVVNGGVVCIRRSPVRLELRITHGLNNYLIPLSQRQYDELVNALNTYWGWVPPECPRVKPVAPEATPSVGGDVLWRWSVRKYNVMFYIAVGVIVFYMLYYIVSTLISLRVITENALIALAVMFGLAGISARWTYRYYKRILRSDVREIVLTSDGFTITDKNGNTFFIPRDEALDSICVGGTALLPPIGNAPPTGSNIEYILFINYNGVTYRVPMLRGEFNRLQEVLSRAWGRSIRGC
jgi:hypothetical protein